MALPLTVRKNIKDNEAKRDTHLATIAKVTGATYTYEVEIPSIHAVLSTDREKDSVGAYVYDSFLGGLASNLTEFCKNDLQKDGLNEAASTKKITMKADGAKCTGSDPKVLIEEGVVIIYVNDNKKSKCFPANVNATGNPVELLKVIPGLALKKNFKDNEAKRDENLAKIEKATGRKFTLEIEDVAKFNEAATAADMNKTPNKVGTICWNWLAGGLAGHIAKLCADEMSKEAFLEAVKKDVILIQLQEKVGGYGTAQIKDGQLILAIDPTRASGANAGDAGNNLVKLL